MRIITDLAPVRLTATKQGQPTRRIRRGRLRLAETPDGDTIGVVATAPEDPWRFRVDGDIEYRNKGGKLRTVDGWSVGWSSCGCSVPRHLSALDMDDLLMGDV